MDKREHPLGEKGVKLSLEKVAERIASDYTDPRIRAWAIECLERARRDGKSRCRTELERAQVLLAAVQKKLWVPDPYASEWIAGSHLTACVDKDAPCFHGGDCDDLVALLGSCLLSVGLPVAVVGHSYNAAQQISHVLCSVRIGGRWQYADPSSEYDVGHCDPFTRERILSVPNVKLICDSDVCLRDPRQFDPIEHGFVTGGTYVGVDGRPKFAWLSSQPRNARPPSGRRLEWLSAPPESTAPGVGSADAKTTPEKLTTIEKVLVAGLVLNVLGLGWSFYQWYYAQKRKPKELTA